MPKLKKKAPLFCQVGVWIRPEQLELVWFDRQQQGQSMLIPINEIALAAHKIRQQLPDKSPLTWISGILPHNLWTKTLLFPNPLSQQEAEQQVQYILENELPTPLQEIWFDYWCEPLKQGTRLDIFAIMKKVATAHLAQLMPLKPDVLDNAAHGIVRAFRFLQPTITLDDTLLLYQDDQCAIAILEKPQQTLILQQGAIPLTELVSQFCQRYSVQPAQCLVYCSQSTELPDHWQRVDCSLPFIALGLALWRQPLVKNEE